jgi:hypothetical protein
VTSWAARETLTLETPSLRDACPVHAAAIENTRTSSSQDALLVAPPLGRDARDLG